MGHAATLKKLKRDGVTLEEVEARRLLVAQNNERQALLDARAAVDRANAVVAAARKAKDVVFDALAKKYHLDPTKAYALDDEALTLTPR